MPLNLALSSPLRLVADCLRGVFASDEGRSSSKRKLSKHQEYQIGFTFWLAFEPALASRNNLNDVLFLRTPSLYKFRWRQTVHTPIEQHKCFMALRLATPRRSLRRSGVCWNVCGLSPAFQNLTL